MIYNYINVLTTFEAIFIVITVYYFILISHFLIIYVYVYVYIGIVIVIIVIFIVFKYLISTSFHTSIKSLIYLLTLHL